MAPQNTNDLNKEKWKQCTTCGTYVRASEVVEEWGAEGLPPKELCDQCYWDQGEHYRDVNSYHVPADKLLKHNRNAAFEAFLDTCGGEDG